MAYGLIDLLVDAALLLPRLRQEQDERPLPVNAPRTGSSPARQTRKFEERRIDHARAKVGTLRNTATVGTFLAAVQAQTLALAYDKPGRLLAVSTALGFAGMLLSVLSTLFALASAQTLAETLSLVDELRAYVHQVQAPDAHRVQAWDAHQVRPADAHQVQAPDAQHIQAGDAVGVLGGMLAVVRAARRERGASETEVQIGSDLVDALHGRFGALVRAREERKARNRAGVGRRAGPRGGDVGIQAQDAGQEDTGTGDLEPTSAPDWSPLDELLSAQLSRAVLTETSAPLDKFKGAMHRLRPAAWRFEVMWVGAESASTAINLGVLCFMASVMCFTAGAQPPGVYVASAVAIACVVLFPVFHSLPLGAWRRG